jgi:hypothetical protein
MGFKKKSWIMNNLPIVPNDQNTNWNNWNGVNWN